MTKLLIAISFLLFVGSPFANAENIYYCASELSTGFWYNKSNDTWEITSFKQKRLTLKFRENYTKLDGVNDYMGTWNCHRPHHKFTSWVICNDRLMIGNIFSFNIDDYRFLLSTANGSGYNSNAKDPDSESMYGGTCKKF